MIPLELQGVHVTAIECAAAAFFHADAAFVQTAAFNGGAAPAGATQ